MEPQTVFRGCLVVFVLLMLFSCTLMTIGFGALVNGVAA